jgi:arylmalonate decarboxylase
MRKDCTIGLVVPFASDTVPEEGLQMYPGVRFVARGVGVRSLTPTGYDGAWEGILPAAQYLAGLGVDAVMVIGTSLTFYRGADAHEELMAKLRAATGLPVSTMSQAVVDGLRSFGARRIAVATAYADEVNARLQAFLIAKGFEVPALEGFGLFGFGEPDSKSKADIIALGSKVCAAAPAADGLLISCGGLRTLAWHSRSKSATAFRSSRARRRRSGRRCGSSARAAASPAAGGSSINQQPPLCTEALCA